MSMQSEKRRSMEILVSAWLSEADATKMEIGELGRGMRLDGVLLVR
jgi:hypothetical protein